MTGNCRPDALLLFHMIVQTKHEPKVAPQKFLPFLYVYLCTYSTNLPKVAHLYNLYINMS